MAPHKALETREPRFSLLLMVTGPCSSLCGHSTALPSTDGGSDEMAAPTGPWTHKITHMDHSYIL